LVSYKLWRGIINCEKFEWVSQIRSSVIRWEGAASVGTYSSEVTSTDKGEGGYEQNVRFARKLERRDSVGMRAK
jgi:hypothetical protein